MKYNLKSTSTFSSSDLIVLPVWSDDKDLKFSSAWDKVLKEFFERLTLAKNFKASAGDLVFFNSIEGQNFAACALAQKKITV